MIVNFKTQEVYSIMLQFTFKDPWLFPKCDNHFGRSNLRLYGWIFFYFCRVTEGVVVKSDVDENIKIRDRKGNGYYLYTAKDREMRDNIRRAIKNKFKFRFEQKDNDTIIIAE